MRPPIIRYATRQAILLAVFALNLSAAELRIEGDRLSLTADREPIASVLAAFARQGVRVKLDPAVTGTITLSARRQDAEAVLRAMMKDWDYFATWRRVAGPLGPIPVLEELMVFRPGRKDAAKPLAGALSPAPATKRILRQEYMAGDLLVRVSTNASPERFLALVAQYGGRVADSLPSLGIYKIAFPPDTDIPALARELAGNPLFAAVEPNFVYRIPLPETAVAAGSAGTGRAIRNAPSGSRPAVAVLDTGFSLADNPLVSWLDAAAGSPEPVDRQGHGTQMALLAQGMMQPIGGVSPSDSLLPVLAIRIADQHPFVAGDTLMKSLQAAIDQNVRVVSLSWGSDMPSAYLNDLLKTAMAKGIVVVAAAGNEPSGTPRYPAAFPGVVAVGAVNPNGTPASYSNYGDFLDLSAPGSAYLSGLPGVARQAAVGTSVATAYAAHVLGLYFQAHPDATAAQALAALQNAVAESKGTGWNPAYGAGVLNAAAVDRLLNNATLKNGNAE